MGIPNLCFDSQFENYYMFNKLLSCGDGLQRGGQAEVQDVTGLSRVINGPTDQRLHHISYHHLFSAWVQVTATTG